MAEKDLLKTIVKGRIDTYYLVPERDLLNLKSNSIAADICFLIASVSLGAYIEGQSRLFLVVGILGIFLSIFFYYLNVSLIRDTKKSGEIEEIKKTKFSDFTIVKATYGTTSERTINITERLNNQVRNGRLNIAATNEIAGSDPDPGTVKYLEIEYVYGDTTLTKKYKEMENIDLP